VSRKFRSNGAKSREREKERAFGIFVVGRQETLARNDDASFDTLNIFSWKLFKNLWMSA